MRTSTIRLIIALAAFSIIGIVVTQVYWVRIAYDMKERQFNQSVHIALKSVAERFSELNETILNSNPVNQLSSNYFVVNVNDAIDANILEHYLEDEFGKLDLNMDYEYGIYDCTSDKMVYGNYITHKNSGEEKASSGKLPKWDEFIYYFGVRFPEKRGYLISQMGFWVFSSSFLILVCGFFAYTLFVIFKQKRLSEIQRDFVNNMTHEFKTPISTIGVSVDLISNPKIFGEPKKLLNYVNIIKSQNTRLKNQIEKVLQMAMMERAQLKLSKEVVDFHSLIREAVENFRMKQEGQMRLTCHLNAPHPFVYADRVHLTNIIYNLLDNATKYVDRNPEIILRTEMPKKNIRFSIQDNGIGISKNHQKKIFDKFFRVPTGNVHNVKGFGLGLNYVKQIVKAHHWKIHLNSELNKGTTFFIDLPVCSDQDMERKESEDVMVSLN